MLREAGCPSLREHSAWYGEEGVAHCSECRNARKLRNLPYADNEAHHGVSLGYADV